MVNDTSDLVTTHDHQNDIQHLSHVVIPEAVKAIQMETDKYLNGGFGCGGYITEKKNTIVNAVTQIINSIGIINDLNSNDTVTLMPVEEK